MSKDPIFQLCDVVRETSYAIHCYLGPGHLEKVYENALAHRLRKQGLDVKQQYPLTVYDEDGTVLGEYLADLLVENSLIVELKAARAIADEHVAQLLGYLRASRREHGLLVNFGASRFAIKKYAMSEKPTPPSSTPQSPLWSWFFLLLSLFASLCVFCGYSSAAEKPNIVFLLADDLGYGDLGCTGHPYARTPTIDRLAKEGALFKNFYVGGATCALAARHS